MGCRGRRRLNPRCSGNVQPKTTAASRTAVVTPDEKALVDIGKNVLDPAKRADAARSGLRQAAAVVDKVRKAWL